MAEAYADGRAALAHAADGAMRIGDMLAWTAGSASIFDNLGLERCVRDLQAAISHLTVDQAKHRQAGRLRLGLPAKPGLL